MRIISAEERLAEKRGAKILLVGPSGVGKTSAAANFGSKRDFVRRCRSRRSLHT